MWRSSYILFPAPFSAASGLHPQPSIEVIVFSWPGHMRQHLFSRSEHLPLGEVPFSPSSQGTAPPGPSTWGPWSERSCYLYQLISFSAAPSVCLPPWSLLAPGRCFPRSRRATQHPLLARGWVLTQSFPLVVPCATESSGKIHSNSHSGFTMT